MHKPSASNRRVNRITFPFISCTTKRWVLRGEYFSRARHFALFPLAGKHLALHCFLIVGDKLILARAPQIRRLAIVEEAGGTFYDLTTDQGRRVRFDHHCIGLRTIPRPMDFVGGNAMKISLLAQVALVLDEEP